MALDIFSSGASACGPSPVSSQREVGSNPQVAGKLRPLADGETAS
jgi:hypothetical protein